jgi:hypothetical protein
MKIFPGEATTGGVYAGGGLGIAFYVAIATRNPE